MDLSGIIYQNNRSYLDLANHHLSEDLTQTDRDALNKAAARIKTYTYAGAIIGSGIGLAWAARGRARMMQAIKLVNAAPKPAEVIMQDGKHVKVPQGPDAAAPGPMAGFLSTLMLSFIGLFAGTQIGLLAGTTSARGIVAKEADQGRMLNAYKAFRVDLLKNELKKLEQGDGNGRPIGEDGGEFKGFWH